MDSVAMPLIGTGAAGWPKQLAAEVCLEEVSNFLRAGPSSLKVSHDAISSGDFCVLLATLCIRLQGCRNLRVSAFVGLQLITPYIVR